MSNGLKKIIKFFLIFIIFSCGCLLYGRYIATTGLFVKEYKITDSKITDNFHGLKIVHISDIHYGRTVKNRELKNMVKKVNELRPDVVVLTGDLIDKDTKLTEKMSNNISSILSKIDPSIEKYAITGNHDVKFDNFNIIIENAGFVNLNNTYDNIKVGVVFGGMSTEHDVSIVSGTSVAKKLNDKKYKVYPIYIDNNGGWHKCLDISKKYEVGDKIENIEKIENIIEYLKEMDVIFPVLHGLYGEDGTIQGLFELLKKPYVGCKVMGSSIAMDKIYAKIIFDKAKIKQAKYEYVKKDKNEYIYVDKDFNETKKDLKEICKIIEKNIK